MRTVAMTLLALVVAALSLVLRVVLTLAIIGLVGLEWLLPRLERWTRPVRKKMRQRLRREWRKTKLTPLRSVVAAALLGLVGLNGAVRLSGGAPGWLDGRHLGDKARAVGMLGWHFLWFHRDRSDLGAVLDEAARANGIPRSWVVAVARTESGLRPHVISHAGAMGLMQLMPDTAVEMGVPDPFDPYDNAAGGARYLAWLRKRYGDDIERIAAAYHAGPGAVPVRGKMKVGARTRRYARLVARRATALEAKPPRS